MKNYWLLGLVLGLSMAVLIGRSDLGSRCRASQRPPTSTTAHRGERSVCHL